MAKTKNTHAFQNDIKHYDKIRDILRYLYLYGGSTKEELVEKKLITSISSFYDTIQRIENYIDGSFLKEHKSAGKSSGKKYRLMYDPFLCPVNYFAETYQNCSFVIDDFIFYFFLMQAFIEKEISPSPYGYCNFEDDGSLAMDEEFSISELAARIGILYDKNRTVLEELNHKKTNEIHSELLFTAPKIRARVFELVSLGILVPASKNTYKLSGDIFADLSADELSDVQLMTQFFYNCSFLTIPGFYLSATIGQYSQAHFMQETESFFNKQENPVFFYKNNHLQSVIDDNVTWILVNAIHNADAVHYTYRAKNGSLSEYDMLPIKIVMDRQYGRQYFFGYNYSDKKFHMPRISSVSGISVTNKIKEPQKFEFIPASVRKEKLHEIYHQIYLQNMENAWNISLGTDTVSVHLTFQFPKKDYGRFLDRLHATMRNGTLEELGNGQIDFHVRTRDELELVPWIRSFAPYVTVDSVQNPALAEKLKADWKEALSQYGIIS